MSTIPAADTPVDAAGPRPERGTINIWSLTLDEYRQLNPRRPLTWEPIQLRYTGARADDDTTQVHHDRWRGR